MKKILITGASSYIGTSFEKYMRQWPNEYLVDTIDMIDGTWRKKGFHEYDAVFHVAGIVHERETKQNTHLFYDINRDLAIETAQKAKDDGIKQFVFLSSISVYGMDNGVITADTFPKPKTNYGKSKLQAEEGIAALQSESFGVAILRPPMVYGNGCKGNFRTFVEIVKKYPIFPNIKNQRSMIYIDNLCEYIHLIIENERCGMFFPQNKEYTQTTEMAKLIAVALNKKIYCSYILGFVVAVGRLFIPKMKKAFSSLIYTNMEDFSYTQTTLSESILKSVG